MNGHIKGFKLFCLMSIKITWLAFLIFAFAGCSNKYKPFKNRYQFKSIDGSPDYSSLSYWAAHPAKWDPSDSIPEPLRNEIRDSSVDVFFLHPTTFTKKKYKKLVNASIDDAYLNAKTDYSSMLYQASVFNNQCRVFAPRYRQAHITNFFTSDKKKSSKAFELAYQDVITSFFYYMKNWNKGRPFIIAGHSQGSFLAERLLKEFFDHPNDSIQNKFRKKLVVVYILGWPVPKEYFSSLRMCTDSLQTGCICSWRTLRKGFIPRYLENENGNSYITNPLNWSTNTEFVSRKFNKGSVLTHFNSIYPHTADAQISNGLLYTRKPKFPWSFLYFTRNYHIGDINLYYINLRENIAHRIQAYHSQY